MEKLINLQQPFAQMLVQRLIRAVHINALQKDVANRILIYAKEPKDLNSLPLECRQEILNQQVFGNLAPIDKLPVNAFVGFVDVLSYNVNFEKEIWLNTMPKPCYAVLEAFAFDEPLSVKPDILRTNLIEVLPSHIFEPQFAYATSQTLFLPVNKRIFAIAANNGSFRVELNEDIASLIMDENGEVKHFTSFSLTCGNRIKKFVWTDDCDIEWEQDPKTDELVLYPSAKADCALTPRAALLLSCLFPLND